LINKWTTQGGTHHVGRLYMWSILPAVSSTLHILSLILETTMENIKLHTCWNYDLVTER
jgi:hypothetical protein